MLEEVVYRVMRDSCRGGFVFSTPGEKKDWLLSQLCRLPQTIASRAEAYTVYQNYLGDLENHDVRVYPFEEGAVPWRFNILVEPELRRRIIDTCLEKGQPVSDWYPRVTSMFAVNDPFPGAKWHEQRILNFPLMIDKAGIRGICDTIRAVL